MLAFAARRAAGASQLVAGRAAASARFLSTEAEPASKGMVLNFCLPHAAIYSNKSVDQVIIPGAAGEYGVTAGHSPVVAELKPGVVQIIHAPNEPPERYFVSAGFALTHANSVTDITAIEAVKVNELDESAVKDAYSSAKSAFDAAADGSKDKAAAQVGMETASAMASALGVSIA